MNGKPEKSCPAFKNRDGYPIKIVNFAHSMIYVESYKPILTWFGTGRHGLNPDRGFLHVRPPGIPSVYH